MLESALLIMNALCILHDKFLKKSMPFPTPITFVVGLHFESLNLVNNTSKDASISTADTINQGLGGQRNQTILFLHTFRKFMTWPLVALNIFFILLELLVG
jgi:hypothetical protein